MTKPIISGATFPVSPQTLFRTFMDARLHAAAIGDTARINPKVGGRFALFGNSILGRTLHVVPGSLVVQTWRGSHWRASDPDSILVVRFSGTAKKGRMELVHEGVPAHDWRGVTEGWKQYYWKPWAAYFGKRARSKR